MTRQTREQINARERKRRLRPEVKKALSIINRRRYLKKKHADKPDCQPDYGIVFHGSEVQKILTKWGG